MKMQAPGISDVCPKKLSRAGLVICGRYLFKFSIPIGFETIGCVQLDGAGADDFDAALSVLTAQRPDAAVHLHKHRDRAW